MSNINGVTVDFTKRPRVVYVPCTPSGATFQDLYDTLMDISDGREAMDHETLASSCVGEKFQAVIKFHDVVFAFNHPSRELVK